jgi:hypothetical protein
MRVRRLSAAGCVLVAACAGRSAAPVAELEPEPIVVVMPPAQAAWALTWRGQAIGGAWERDAPDHFERRERIVVKRGEDIVISDLAITIERDERGEPYQVGVTRWQDGPVFDGTAMRTVDGGWSVEIEGEPRALLPAAAPFELVLRDGKPFQGTVLLAGWGFATAQLELGPSERDPRDMLARLEVGGRTLQAMVTYDDDGGVASVVGGDGITATRAPVDADLRPTNPPEVVDGNAITVAGHGRTLLLLDASAPAPPELPGQRPVPGQMWTVILDPSADSRDLLPELRTRDRSHEIAGLVHRVSREIADDLASTATTTGAALAATHGDCTTHALRFAALAADAGIPARVVTGLRLDEGALVRHRWNVAWTGARWITVDPTFDEAPATPALVGLAVHGARAADLAAADATVFDGLGTRAELR